MFPKIHGKSFQIRIGCSYELNEIVQVQYLNSMISILVNLDTFVTTYFQPVYFEHNQNSGTLY
jgi:hypothetical protein